MNFSQNHIDMEIDDWPVKGKQRLTGFYGFQKRVEGEILKTY